MTEDNVEHDPEPSTPSEADISASKAQESSHQIERLSPREELVSLADEWIAATGDEQEKQALRATKEDLLVAFDQAKSRKL